MKKIISLLLTLSLMLLHQECRVTNLDPVPVTQQIPFNGGMATVSGTSELRDNVLIVDTSSVKRVISFSSRQIVYEGTFKVARQGAKGGRLAALPCDDIVECLLPNGTNIYLTLEDGSAVLLQSADKITVAGGKVTIFYKLTAESSLTELFKSFDLDITANYPVPISDDAVIRTTDGEASFGIRGELNIIGKAKLKFTNNRFQYSQAYMSVSSSVDISRSNFNGSFEGVIYSKELGGLPEIPVPIIIPVPGGAIRLPGKLKVSLFLTVEVNAKGVNITGNLLKGTAKAVANYEVTNTDGRIEKTPKENVLSSDLSTFEKPNLQLTSNSKFTIYLCFKVKGELFISAIPIPDKLKEFAEAIPDPDIKEEANNIIKALDGTALLTVGLIGRLCQVTEVSCDADIGGLKATFSAGFDGIDVFVTFPWVTQLNRLVNALLETNGSLFTGEFSQPYYKDYPKVPLGDINFAGLGCAPISVTTAQPPSDCIPQAILTQVAKKQLNGFTSLAEGNGNAPPTFTPGSVFEFIPKLHSSSRAEDKDYLDKEFGNIRLRFTYPDGKLTVELKQYDDADKPNVILSGDSEWANVTGHDNVFRICMSLKGTTNRLTYTNRVVIIGRLNASKNTISDLSYIMLVGGGNTTTYLLNGNSVRVFRSDENAMTTGQFRIAAEEVFQPSTGLSLMAK